MRITWRVLLFATSLGLATPLSAYADCADLSYQRNALYKAAGYCFKTAAQIRIFGNAGCQYDSQRDVPLSARDRDEIAAIVEEERSIGCR